MATTRKTGAVKKKAATAKRSEGWAEATGKTVKSAAKTIAKTTRRIVRKAEKALEPVTDMFGGAGEEKTTKRASSRSKKAVTARAKKTSKTAARKGRA
jgi:hypothetical protein